MPYRPQYLQVQLLMAERQPTGEARSVELELIKG